MEEECVPLLESVSGLKSGDDFSVSYSSERINSGDKEHRFETITKVVSGQDGARSTPSPMYMAPSLPPEIHRARPSRSRRLPRLSRIRSDLNIAFMNELSALFERLGIDTGGVLAAAANQVEFFEILAGSCRRVLALARLQIRGDLLGRSALER